MHVPGFSHPLSHASPGCEPRSLRHRAPWDAAGQERAHGTALREGPSPRPARVEAQGEPGIASRTLALFIIWG